MNGQSVFIEGDDSSFVISYDSFLKSLRDLPITGRASRMPMLGVKLAVFSSPSIVNNPFRGDEDHNKRQVKAIEFLPKRVIIPDNPYADRELFGWKVPNGIVLVDMEPRSATY